MADPLLLLAVKPMPITTTINCPLLDLKSLNNLIGVRGSILAVVPEIKSDLAVLSKELKLLSQLLYKIHNRFRNDKGYKDIRMFEKSLQKFLALNFLKSVDNYLNFLPSHPSSSPNLPTKEMLRYSCLQLYGAGALLARLDVLAHNSGLLAIQRLNLGHFWGVATHQLACIARIWVVGRHLLQPIGNVFNLLRNDVVHLLTEEVSKFMELFPNNLDMFVFSEIRNDTHESVKFDSSSCVNNKVDLDSFLDIGIPIKRDVDPLSKIAKKKRLPVVKSLVIDEREEVRHTELKSLNKHRKKLAMKTSDVSRTNGEISNGEISGEIGTGEVSLSKLRKDELSDIHTISDLKQFLSRETAARKLCKKDCLTRKLSQDLWKELKVEVLKNINEKTPNKTIICCRKIIRNRL